MKKRILVLLTAFLLMGAQLYAGNGDLIVDGKLGVGTASPQQPLHVLGTNKKVARFDTGGGNAQTFVEFVNNTKVWQIGNHDAFDNFTDWGVRNATDGINPLNITASGNVGIGITAPQQPLHILGTNKKVARFDTGGGNAQTFVEFVNNTKVWQVGNHDAFGNYTDWGVRNATDGINPLNITASGNVGIGTTTPAGKLDVWGQIYQSGSLIHSDIKFKKNLLPITDPVNKILGLNGLSYEWRNEEFRDRGFPEGRHYGVIAQEVEKVLPEVVTERPDGTKTVAYTEIIPVLIEAIKEQQKIIEKQQQELAEIRSLVERLSTANSR